MDETPEVEHFYKLDNGNFWRSDRVGTFQFQGISAYCSKCSPNVANWRGYKYYEPAHFPAELPFDKVIRLVCSTCNHIEARFVVHEGKP